MLMQEKKDILAQKGVCFPLPGCVEIGDDVDPDRILSGSTIYGGSKIYGPDTLICKGAEIGYESPVTLENCHVGPAVRLGGGFFKNAVFLKGAKTGPNAHVREGTILEESASIAHSVGLKQTILFPYVTLGSLVNFCDCLMAGGTGPKNHSEVGSAYIHFNFTPLQDKATPSLIGDVPEGVMLNREPIFLGGQGGLVGPCRLNFGTVVAAGTICRRDELRSGRLIFGGPSREGNVVRSALTAGNPKRVMVNNLIYIGNLMALKQWYISVRGLFISDDFPILLYQGLCETLTSAIYERFKRLEEYIHKIKEKDNRNSFLKLWDSAAAMLRNPEDSDETDRLRNQFLEVLDKKIKNNSEYLMVIKLLSEKETEIGSAWLNRVVADTGYAALQMLNLENDKGDG